MMYIFSDTNSPFSKNNTYDGTFEEKKLDVSGVLSSFEHWSDYLIGSLLLFLIVLFIYSVGKLIYGLAIKNGGIQKSAVFGTIISVFLFLVVRIGFPLVIALSEYGLNNFLMDLISFSSSSLLYFSVGVMLLGAGYYFIYYLIKHPAMRRRSSQFVVGSVVLIIASFIVPVVFLQV